MVHGHQDPGHPDVRLDLPPDALHLAGDLLHAADAPGVDLRGNDHSAAAGNGGHAGGAEGRRAVEDHHVEGVVVGKHLQKISQGLQAFRPALPDAGDVLLQQADVRREDAHILLLRLQDELRPVDAAPRKHVPQGAARVLAAEKGRGVGLGVRVDQQDPQAVIGPQDGGQVAGGDGLPHPALQIDDAVNLHFLKILSGPFGPQIVLVRRNASPNRTRFAGLRFGVILSPCSSADKSSPGSVPCRN